MTSDLEIRHCRALAAVADHGSISSAARALGVAQSTLSEALLSLERLLGLPVTVRRSGQEATLTAAALRILPHARALVAAAEATMALFANGGGGAIRLGAVESASTYLLPPAMAAFRSAWPQVEIQVAVGVCEELRRNLQVGELDAIVTYEPAARQAAHDRPAGRVLAPSPICLFVSAAREEPGGTSRQVLAMRRYLLPDPGGSLQDAVRTWLAAATGGGSPRLESAGSIEGVKRGVRSGKPVGVLPRYAVAGELRDGVFKELKSSTPLPEFVIGLGTRCEPLPGTPLHALSQCLAQHVATLARPASTVNAAAGRRGASGKPRRKPAAKTGRRPLRSSPTPAPPRPRSSR
jgi:DNA-binding transcriptional LysR family regulator